MVAEADRDLAVMRWGGASLAVCATALTVTIILYVFAYEQPDGTGIGGEITLGDKAAHLLDKWGLISKVWLIEALAWVFMAVAGFVLQHRASSGSKWFPSRVAWVTVGIGAVVQSLMYAFMLGGYPAAAQGYEAFPVLLDALNGAAIFLFSLGNAVVYFGLGGAFLAEASPDGVISRWVARFGAVVCFVSTALMVGLLAGMVEMGEIMVAAPAGLLGFVITIYLGWSIWRHG